jgi:hypothetical protein
MTCDHISIYATIPKRKLQMLHALLHFANAHYEAPWNEIALEALCVRQGHYLCWLVQPRCQFFDD